MQTSEEASVENLDTFDLQTTSSEESADLRRKGFRRSQTYGVSPLITGTGTTLSESQVQLVPQVPKTARVSQPATSSDTQESSHALISASLDWRAKCKQFSSVRRLVHSTSQTSVGPRQRSSPAGDCSVTHVPGLMCSIDFNGRISSSSKDFRHKFPFMENLIDALLPAEGGSKQGIVTSLLQSPEWEGDIYIGEENAPAWSTHLQPFLHVRSKRHEDTYLIGLQDITEATAAVRLGQAQARIVNTILPTSIVQRMSLSGGFIPDSLMTREHLNVTVMFADIVGYTKMSSEVSSDLVMAYLNDLFKVFDEIAATHNVFKYETIGDCYVAVTGMMDVSKDGSFEYSQEDPLNTAHGSKAVVFARSIQVAALSHIMPGTTLPTRMRVGLHSGPVTSGFVNPKAPKLSLIGDTVNIASRMESTGSPDHIQLSAQTYKLLSPTMRRNFEYREHVLVKGKGEMDTWLWALPNVGGEGEGKGKAVA